MPRVQTTPSKDPLLRPAAASETEAPPLIYLTADQLELRDVPGTRPGPPPQDEEQEINYLADSMQVLGQLQPVLVSRLDNDWLLIDGRRRLRAAVVIEARTGEPFPLTCCERPDTDSFQAAVQANTKRRAYTPLQFARLCREVRRRFDWPANTDTKRVSDFFGCSDAQVRQHEKLLVQPHGMSAESFVDLQDRIAQGGMGSEAAFYALTQVEPEKIAPVVERAGRIASESKRKAKTAQDELSVGGPSLPTAQGPATAPTSQSSQPRAIVAPAPITRKHLRKAARELGAERSTRRRTPADLLDLMQELKKAFTSGPLGALFHLILGDWIAGKADLGAVINLCSQVEVATSGADAITRATKAELARSSPPSKKRPKPVVKKPPLKKSVKKPAPKKTVVLKRAPLPAFNRYRRSRIDRIGKKKTR